MEVLILKGGFREDVNEVAHGDPRGGRSILLRHSTRDPPSPNSTDPGVEGSAFRILTPGVASCVFTGFVSELGADFCQQLRRLWGMSRPLDPRVFWSPWSGCSSPDLPCPPSSAPPGECGAGFPPASLPQLLGQCAERGPVSSREDASSVFYPVILLNVMLSPVGTSAGLTPNSKQEQEAGQAACGTRVGAQPSASARRMRGRFRLFLGGGT